MYIHLNPYFTPVCVLFRIILINLFLEKYSLYEVRVSASTSVGEGKNASSEFRTEEDSEFSCTIFANASLILFFLFILFISYIIYPY